MRHADGHHAKREGVHVVRGSVEGIHDPHPLLVNHVRHRLAITKRTMEHLSIFSPLDILLSQQHMLGILLLHIPKPINFSNHFLLQNHILVRRIHLGDEILEIDLRLLHSHVYGSLSASTAHGRSDRSCSFHTVSQWTGCPRRAASKLQIRTGKVQSQSSIDSMPFCSESIKTANWLRRAFHGEKIPPILCESRKEGHSFFSLT